MLFCCLDLPNLITSESEHLKRTSNAVSTNAKNNSSPSSAEATGKQSSPDEMRASYQSQLEKAVAGHYERMTMCNGEEEARSFNNNNVNDFRRMKFNRKLDQNAGQPTTDEIVCVNESKTLVSFRKKKSHGSKSLDVQTTIV